MTALLYESPQKLADDIKSAVLDYPSCEEEEKYMTAMAKAAEQIAQYIWNRYNK